jgi:hypothetical protein
MKKELATFLVNYLPDAEIREDYSGRGMFGKTTCAITGEFTTGEIVMAVAELVYDSHDEMDEFNPQDFYFHTDSMGLGMVIY